MHWYKYTRIEFARALVEQGQLRLSKIEIYHDVDRLGDAIGDVEEGFLALEHHIDSETAIRDLGDFGRQLFAGPAVDDGTATIRNMTLVQKETPASVDYDQYIYCCSRTLSEGLLRRMNEENANDSYDACVRITDHVRFKDILSAHLTEEHKLFIAGWGDCYYKGRVADPLNFTGPRLAGLRKPPEFQWQEEKRLVFVGPKTERQYIDICIPELCEYVELVDL